jgi:hypothetical protein
MILPITDDLVLRIKGLGCQVDSLCPDVAGRAMHYERVPTVLASDGRACFRLPQYRLARSVVGCVCLRGTPRGRGARAVIAEGGDLALERQAIALVTSITYDGTT